MISVGALREAQARSRAALNNERPFSRINEMRAVIDVIDRPYNALTFLPALADADIHGESAILIPDAADTDAGRRLVIELDHLPLS